MRNPTFRLEFAYISMPSYRRKPVSRDLALNIYWTPASALAQVRQDWAGVTKPRVGSGHDKTYQNEEKNRRIIYMEGSYV